MSAEGSVTQQRGGGAGWLSLLTDLQNLAASASVFVYSEHHDLFSGQPANLQLVISALLLSTVCHNILTYTKKIVIQCIVLIK